MDCAACGWENPDGAKFCIECGTPFKNRCPSCRQENLPRAKFCAECGAPLARQSAVASSQLPVANSQHPAPKSECTTLGHCS
ncbi:MAG: zinc ribbon domain-containing protein [Deltaproteobacteria bacterium]|nr:zinc ribbon domain-containing protein [Deltaproteobacteria bacterium]